MRGLLAIKNKAAIALSTIAKTWKPPKHPLTEEWVKKTCCICRYNGINTGIKPESLNVFYIGRWVIYH